MCLAVPMQIVKIFDNGRGIVRQDDLEAEVDLSLVENPGEGDYVIVHAGYAIEILDLEEAQQRLDLFQAVEEAGRQKRSP
jgi:hydrogenase expression/formation protein HypC